jgi:hypothetical protein
MRASRLLFPCLILVSFGAPARAQYAPPVGTVEVLPVISASLAVGSTGKDMKRAVYAPPPGWYVRSHRVVVTHKYGVVSYSVSTLPALWNWKANEQSASSDRTNVVAAVAAYKVAGGGQFANAGETTASDYTAVMASHHALVLDVSARGCGFLQSGSGVDLVVFAEIVYLGR